MGVYLPCLSRNLFFFLCLVTCALAQLEKRAVLQRMAGKERLNQESFGSVWLKVGFEHSTSGRSCKGSSSPLSASPAAPNPSAPLLEATQHWNWDFSVCALI